MNASPVTRETMEDLFRLIGSGQIQHAESRCRALLNAHPDDVNLLALLGAIHLKLGRKADAESLLKRAIDLEPGFAKPHEDLGVLHLDDENYAAALPCFREAIRLDGNQASAWAGLAAALRELGDARAAEEALRKSTELSPVARTLSRASELLKSGQRAEAERLCQQAASEDPLNTDVLRMLARIATEDDRLVVAESFLRRIVRLSENSSRAHADMGLFLGGQGRFPEAVEFLQRAADLRPDSVPVRQRLGDYLAILGKPEAALDAYDDVLQHDRTYAPAHIGRGHMLKVLGHSDDSVAAYESATRLRPELGDAWWSLARLPSYEFAEPQIEEIKHQLGASDGSEARLGLHFALARHAEKLEDFEMAWEHYRIGNDLKRSTVNYDPVQIEVMHDSIIDVFDEELFGRAQIQQRPEATPVFIVGMPRSGSTLVEQILASHREVQGTSELPYMGMLSEALAGKQSGNVKYPESVRNLTGEQLLAFGRSYLRHTRDARTQNLAYFTDKMPANFVHAGLIHLALPQARIIDVRRNALDTCIGNYRQLFARGKNFTYDLTECAEYYLEYVRIMDHWEDVLPGRILRIDYEDVVADVETEARRMLEYCGLPWDDACLRFHENLRAVNTASAEQVRLPIYRHGMGYWKHYEPWLDDVREILRPMPAAQPERNRK